MDELKAAARGAVAGSRTAGRFEESHWLCPMEDRRSKGAAREGMLEGFSLGSYLLLVDYTARLYRNGKARMSREQAGILGRLGTSQEIWDRRLEKLRDKSREMGHYFSTQAGRTKEIAARRGVHHVDNVARVD